MAAHECLVCGAASTGEESGRCAECGGEHLISFGRGPRAERRPATYGPGDHVAVLYGSDDRCMSVLLPFVRDGIASGNRLAGVVDERTRDQLRAQLTSAEARRIEMVAPGDQYGAVFSADRVCELWSELIASTDGILRAFGGLDAQTAASVDPAELARYERTLPSVLREEALGLCMYDARYCSRELLDAGVGHPLIAARDKVHVCA